MKDFKISNDGDVVFEKGDIQLVEHKEEVLQQIRAIFRSRKGEWYMNPEYGLNYDNILGKQINLDLIKDEVRDGLSQCSAVVSIGYIDIDFNRSKRELIITFEAIDIEDNTITANESFTV